MNVENKEMQTQVQIGEIIKKKLSYTITFTPEFNAKLKKLCEATGHQTVASLIRGLLIQEIKDRNI
jgi:hypothetical protein